MLSLGVPGVVFLGSIFTYIIIYACFDDRFWKREILSYLFRTTWNDFFFGDSYYLFSLGIYAHQDPISIDRASPFLGVGNFNLQGQPSWAEDPCAGFHSCHSSSGDLSRCWTAGNEAPNVSISIYHLSLCIIMYIYLSISISFFLSIDPLFYVYIYINEYINISIRKEDAHKYQYIYIYR